MAQPVQIGDNQYNPWMVYNNLVTNYKSISEYSVVDIHIAGALHPISIIKTFITNNVGTWNKLS